jgi:hypothetical protein
MFLGCGRSNPKLWTPVIVNLLSTVNSADSGNWRYDIGFSHCRGESLNWGTNINARIRRRKDITMTFTITKPLPELLFGGGLLGDLLT